MNGTNVVLICRALGDANRLKIVQILTGGEKCACKLLEELEITQSTLSHHMKILAECGLINTRYEGKWSYFSLNCEIVTDFREFICTLVCKKDSCGCENDCDCK